MVRKPIALLTMVAFALVAACTQDHGVERGAATQRASAETTVTTAVAEPPAETTIATDPPPTTAPAPAPPVLPAIEIGDPNLLTGVLANGLTYYIRHNDNPGRSVELRLAVDAGSGREAADQSGVAHFLEHMLFNGTATFPKNELIDVLRMTGAGFGADINAYTSYDETVYQLTLPTDDPATLGTGLDVLSQWLSAATLDPDEVVKERGVVLDEWRTREESSQGRIQQELQRMFLTGSVYLDRPPIGTSAAIEAMTPELLRRFYDDWYRPDNAAVVVIGDIDVDSALAGIESRFGAIVARGSNPVAEALPISPSTVAVAGLVADPDLTFSAVELALPTVADPPGLETAPAATADALVFAMIANRLSDDATRTAVPFDAARVDSDNFVRMLDAPSVVVNAKPGLAVAAMQALLDEFERVRRFGFDAGELQRAVGQVRADVQTVYDGRDTRQDADYADTYADSFLVDTPILTEQAQFDLETAILDTITVDAVDARFEQRWTSTAPHVVVIGPQSESATLPTPDEITAAVASLPDRSLTAREPTAVVTGELIEPPAAVAETSTVMLTSYPDVFIDNPVQLDFANGVTVILADTPIADGQLVLSAESNGGLAHVANEDIIDARVAVDVVTSGGVGTFDQAQLDQLTAGSTAELYPSVDDTSDTLTGSSTTAHLESLLQLVHLYMTAPRFDTVALDNNLARIRSAAADPLADQSTAAFDALYLARYGDDPRFRYQLTGADADSVDLASIQRVWSTNFGNATGWTFAIVGDLDVAVVTELARQYLGTLVATGPDDAPATITPGPPPGIVTQNVSAGTGDKGSLLRLYSTRVPATAKSMVLADVATEIVSNRILTRIREELGESYSPYAAFGVTPSDVGEDSFLDIYFEVSSAPDQVEPLSVVLSDELASLAGAGASTDEIDAALSVVLEQYLIYNEEIAAVLLGSHRGIGETAQDYNDRYLVLNGLEVSEIGEFVSLAGRLGQFIEIRALPR